MVKIWLCLFIMVLFAVTDVWSQTKVIITTKECNTTPPGRPKEKVSKDCLPNSMKIDVSLICRNQTDADPCRFQRKFKTDRKGKLTLHLKNGRYKFKALPSKKEDLNPNCVVDFPRAIETELKGDIQSFDFFIERNCK